jgi:hypothetical protein
MATLTRQQCEQQAVSLYGRLMTLVGLYGSWTACTGSNPSFDRPLTDALIRMGYTTADPYGLNSVDADFAPLAYGSFRRLMEWTELFTLETVDRDWWRTSIPSVAANMPPKETLDRLLQQVRSRIGELRRIVMMPYQGMNVQIAVGQLVAGTCLDPSIPASMADIINPCLLFPDGLWYYGQYAYAYWNFPMGDWWYV